MCCYLFVLLALQDSLERQQHANDMERARLQGLITKLELQLTEQARELEQVNLSLSCSGADKFICCNDS